MAPYFGFLEPHWTHGTFINVLFPNVPISKYSHPQMLMRIRPLSLLPCGNMWILNKVLRNFQWVEICSFKAGKWGQIKQLSSWRSRFNFLNCKSLSLLSLLSVSYCCISVHMRRLWTVCPCFILIRIVIFF